jgi:hypothetical protein
MRPTTAPPAALIRDTLERLSADDLATVREAEFLEGALAAHQQRAQRSLHLPLGTCANCCEACMPTAFYCDDDCRDDHQARQRQSARVGRSFF